MSDCNCDPADLSTCPACDPALSKPEFIKLDIVKAPECRHVTLLELIVSGDVKFESWNESDPDSIPDKTELQEGDQIIRYSAKTKKWKFVKRSLYPKNDPSGEPIKATLKVCNQAE